MAERDPPAQGIPPWARSPRSEEHTSELQSQSNLVCRLLLEKKKTNLSQKASLRASHHTWNCLGMTWSGTVLLAPNASTKQVTYICGDARSRFVPHVVSTWQK